MELPRVPSGFTTGEATPAERDEALGQTWPYWGGGRTLDAYRARTHELQSTPWGAAHYRFWVLRDPAGHVVSSCKTYDLTMRADGRTVPTVGIGAVFTPPELRRRGLAAALVGSLLAERARRGDRLATLFSDIGTAYYRRLGFVPLRMSKLRADPARLPPAPAGLAWRDAADGEIEEVARTALADALRLGFVYLRETASLAHLAFAYRAPFRFLVRDGRPIGCVFAGVRGDALEVWRWALDDPADTPLLLGMLRHLLPPRCVTVHGWLPGGEPGVRATFDPEHEEDALWMVAPLGPAAPDVGRIAAGPQHAWTDDHF